MLKRLIGGASLLALAATGAGAQDQQDSGGAGVEEIIVTAQFREQRAQDVPLAITAYSGAFLEQIGVSEFDELSNFTPGFVVQEQSVNNPGFVLRGITSDSGASNIEPRVSVFQNGVSISRSRGSIIPLFDVERVEVLKGPQGTLFGRSAQIGAVHVITSKAGNEFEAGAEVEVGNFDQRKATGYINVPAGDTLAVRGAFYYEKRDGFLENTEGGDDLNGTETLAFRGSVRFKPTDDFTLDIVGHYAKDTPPGTSFKSGVIPANGGTTDPNGAASLNTFGGFLDGKELSIDRELYDLTAIASWRMSENWGLVSTTAYREFESLEVFDPDGTAYDIFIFGEDATGEQFSQDVRFSYDAGGRVRGFFGGGIFKEEGAQAVPLGFDVGNAVALFGSLAATSDPENGVAYLGGSVPLTQAYLSGDPDVLAATLAFAGIPGGVYQEETFTNFSDNFSWDIFAEMEVDVTEQLTFTLGGRYTRDEKETLFQSEITTPNPLTPFIIGAPALLAGNTDGQISSDDADVENSFDGFSWRAVLNYAISDDANVYFNYSRGRRPEVIQDDFTLLGDGSVASNFVVVPEETVDSFEVGAKGSFLDGRLTMDVALYYYQYDNFQTTVAVDAGPGQPPVFELVNGGTADSKGIEFGFTANPFAGMELFGTYAYNRGRFNEEDEAGNAQLFGGNQFRLSPDHSFSIGFNYEQEADFGTWFLTPTFTWKDKVYFEDENQDAYDVIDPATGTAVYSVPGVSQDAVGLMNVRAGVRLMENRLTVQAYAENLFDKEYIIDAGNTGGSFGIPTFIAGTPRFYGVSLSVKY
jgi:outer membrane receptor protein involved in Fe transport